MRVLCIKPKDRLRFNGIYTVVNDKTCPTCKLHYYGLAEFPLLNPHPRPWCAKCKGPMPRTNIKHYRAWRFVPIEPDGNVSLDEVKELYRPHKEKV